MYTENQKSKLEALDFYTLYTTFILLQLPAIARLSARLYNNMTGTIL